MAKFENIFSKSKLEAKKAIKAGTLAAGLTAGLILGSPEAAAQDSNHDKNPKKEIKDETKSEIEKQIEKDRQYLESPQRYDLSKKHDISGPKKERQINPAELLKYNIETVKSRLQQTKNWIFLKLTPTGADIVEPDSSDLKRQEKLITEYEEYLANPSLDIKQVGEVEFDQEDFALNKKAFAYHDQKIQEIATHISSPEYLKKLMVEYNTDEATAREHQQTRLNNLYNGTYNLTDKDPNFNEEGENFEVQLPKNINENEFTDEHELLGHKVIDGSHLSRTANKLLILSYKRFDPESPYFKGLMKADNQKDYDYLVNYFGNYFGEKGERYARKQELETEMAKLGIKKYGDKFTKEHYDKLMELYRQGKLSKESCRFIETTKPEYFERIFNEIAATGDENGKTFYNPNWDYGDKNNQA